MLLLWAHAHTSHICGIAVAGSNIDLFLQKASALDWLMLSLKVKALCPRSQSNWFMQKCPNVQALVGFRVTAKPNWEHFLEEPRATSWRYHAECFPARLRLWNYKQWGLPRALMQDWLNALPDSGKTDIANNYKVMRWGGVPCRPTDFAFVWLWQVTGACPTDPLDWTKFLLQSYWLWHRRSQRTQCGGCWHAGQRCKVSSDLLDWSSWDSTETRRRRPLTVMTDLKKCCGGLLLFCLIFLKQ